MKTSRWTRDKLVNAVKESSSVRQVIKMLGLIPAGGNYSQINKYIKEYNLDTTHFKGQAWNKGLTGIGHPRIALDEILVEGSGFQSFKLKKRLFLENIKPKFCEECGWSKKLWMDICHLNYIILMVYIGIID